MTAPNPFKVGDTALWFGGQMGAEHGVSVVITRVVHYYSRTPHISGTYEVLLDGDVCPTRAMTGGLAFLLELKARPKSPDYAVNCALWPLRLNALKTAEAAELAATMLARAERNAVAYAYFEPGTKVTWRDDVVCQEGRNSRGIGIILSKDIMSGTCAIQTVDGVMPAVELSCLKVALDLCKGCGHMERGGCLVLGSCGGGGAP